MAYKIALVFPPPANPTYFPLGLASLISYLKIRVMGVEVSAYDINISAWHALTENNEQGACFWEFMRGLKGPFFDEASYRQYQLLWGDINSRLFKWHDEARAYLNGKEHSLAFGMFLDSTAKKLLSTDPEIIGFSVMFLDQLVFALALAYKIFNLKGSKTRIGQTRLRLPQIVLGGAAMSVVCVEELLKACPFVDAVFTGEGEEGLALLAEGIALEKIPGVYLNYGGEVLLSAKVTILPSSLPMPDFSQFHLNDYASPVPILPLAFSRDCKWGRCRFCAHNFSFSAHREKPISQFVNELEVCIERYGARHFYLADQYIPAKSLEALSDEILRRGLYLSFHVMGRPTSDYTQERLAKAAAAGCCWISWGVETGSQRLLDIIRKGTRRETIARVLGNSYRAGIANLVMLIFGLPTSAEEDLNQTFCFIEDIYPHITAITASSFILFEGTSFARQAQQFNLQITGREELFRIRNNRVHSLRLKCMRQTSTKELLLPSGPEEVSRWKQRRRWLGAVPFIETLCCEHFLIYSSLRRSAPRIAPVGPFIPTRPFRKKAA